MIHLALALFTISAHAGGLSGDAIAAIVNKDLTPFKTCYGANAKYGASGKVLTRFVVGADGKVAKAEVVSDTLENVKLDACVTEALKKLVFPAQAGAGAVQVEYPFVFQPEAKAKKTKH